MQDILVNQPDEELRDPAGGALSGGKDRGTDPCSGVWLLDMVPDRSKFGSGEDGQL